MKLEKKKTHKFDYEIVPTFPRCYSDFKFIWRKRQTTLIHKRVK